MGLFARLTGWNPCGLPRSLPRQRRKTRRGPPDPPHEARSPRFAKAPKGRKHQLFRSRGSFVAPAATKEPRPGTTSPISIPWFLCGALRDKGTTTPESRLALHPVVPLLPLKRQRNHDRRNRRRSSIPWFLSSAHRDKGTTTWGARGAFVPLELWRGAFVPLELLAHGSWRGLERRPRLVGRGGVSLFTFCAAGAESSSERLEAIQPVRRVKRDTPPLHANPVPRPRTVHRQLQNAAFGRVRRHQ